MASWLDQYRAAQEAQQRGWLTHEYGGSAMPLGPVETRASLLPWGRDTYGRPQFAVPGAIRDTYHSLRKMGGHPKPSEMDSYAQPFGIEDALNVAGMVTLGAGAMPAAANELRMGIKAYHGSPHDFDKFELSPRTIGTGEGAQAYGHGLYFAENEGVARSYRDVLAGSWDVLKFTDPQAEIANKLLSNSEKLNAATGNLRDIRAMIEQKQLRLENRKDALAFAYRNPASGMDKDAISKQISDLEDEIKSLSYVESGGWKENEFDSAGRMYEVNLNTNPEDFLDWDKPLSEQPGLARRLGLRVRSEADINAEAWDLLEEYGSVDAMPPAARARLDELNAEVNLPGTTQTGRELYEYGVGRQENAHAFLSGPSASRPDELKAAGIPGIKYLDAGSRAAGEGSHNYVVFDDSIIEILRKYGWAGLAPLMMPGEEQQ